MKPSISEMRENPRFIEELGTWEGWMTPLKAAWKTHVLKIEHPELGTFYLEYVPGDFVMLRDDERLNKLVTQNWEYYCIQRWLDNYKAEFVRRR